MKRVIKTYRVGCEIATKPLEKKGWTVFQSSSVDGHIGLGGQKLVNGVPCCLMGRVGILLREKRTPRRQEVGQGEGKRGGEGGWPRGEEATPTTMEGRREAKKGHNLNSPTWMAPKGKERATWW